MRLDTQIGIIQFHIDIARALIMAADAKFDENKIKRAKDGKFAAKSGGSSTEEESSVKDRVGSEIAQGKASGKAAIDGAASIGSSAAEIGKISGQFIADLVKDKDFRKRAGLVAGKAAASTAQFLAEKAGKFPKLEENLKKMTEDAEKQLGELYGDDKNPVAQSLRNTKIPEPPKDASFKEKLEFQTARYKAYEEALKNPEKFDVKEDQKKELMAKAQKAAVPVAIALACAALPAAMIAGGAAATFGTSMTLANFAIADLTVATMTEVTDVIVEKIGVAERLGTDEAMTKMVIDVSLGMIGGGIIGAGMNVVADAANIHKAVKKRAATAQTEMAKTVKSKK